MWCFFDCNYIPRNFFGCQYKYNYLVICFCNIEAHARAREWKVWINSCIIGQLWDTIKELMNRKSGDLERKHFKLKVKVLVWEGLIGVMQSVRIKGGWWEIVLYPLLEPLEIKVQEYSLWKAIPPAGTPWSFKHSPASGCWKKVYDGVERADGEKAVMWK